MSRAVKQNISTVIKILIGLILIMPLIVTLLLSFQTNDELTTLPFSLFTKHPTLENYKAAFDSYNIFNMLKNTFIVLLISVPTQIFINTVTAYAFAHFDFKGKTLLFNLVLLVMMIPAEVTISANFMTVQRLNLTNTYLGICITSLVSAGSVFMMRQNMLTLPPALWESAKIDGCGDMRYLFSIVFPLCKAIIVASVLTTFIGIYNAYMWPLYVTTNSEMHTMAIGVAQMGEDRVIRPGHMYAGTVLSMIIPVIIYAFGVDRIVEGMTAGAVKS